jgi:hypothetical protein
MYIDYKISEDSQCQVEQMEDGRVITDEDLSERWIIGILLLNWERNEKSDWMCEDTLF